MSYASKRANQKAMIWKQAVSGLKHFFIINAIFTLWRDQL